MFSKTLSSQFSNKSVFQHYRHSEKTWQNSNAFHSLYDSKKNLKCKYLVYKAVVNWWFEVDDITKFAESILDLFSFKIAGYNRLATFSSYKGTCSVICFFRTIQTNALFHLNGFNYKKNATNVQWFEEKN